MNPWNSLSAHWEEIAKVLKPWQMVELSLCGSQNYQMETNASDVDTKLIVVPSFKDIAMNNKPLSHTYVRANMENIDIKDIRNMFVCYKKQNINFVETLFTKWQQVNPLYQEQWNRLVREREVIARLAPHQALKAMKGMALKKLHAMEHPYPSKLEILAKCGYDPKQLSHLLRLKDFIPRYIDGEPYQEILRPRDPAYLIDVKLGKYNLDEARLKAQAAADFITALVDDYCNKNEPTINSDAIDLLNDVQYKIMEIAIKQELK